MSVPELPGFYYDPEKRRYFKIEKNRTAPTDAAWSHDNVKKRRLADEEAAAALQRVDLNKGRISRSRALEAPLMGGFLSREYGSLKPDIPAASFARGLLEKGSMPLAGSQWQTSKNLGTMYVAAEDDRTGLGVAYTCMDDLTLISTYLPRDSNGRIHRQLLSNYQVPFNQSRPYQEMVVPQIADIVYHRPSEQMLLTSRRPNEALVWTFKPKISESNDPSKPLWTLGETDGVTHRVNRIHSASGGPVEQGSPFAGNALAALQEPASTICVVGSDGGVFYWTDRGRLIRLTPALRTLSDFKHQKFKDVFSVDLQPRHEKDVWLFGGRPGSLFVADNRAESSSWTMHAHGSAITHIKSVNEHQVLVAGLKNSMSIYDLRMVKRTVAPPTAPGPPRRAASPVVRFPSYRNLAHIKVGLDLHKDLGIVAAAHDDGKVALYSVRTGLRLPSPDLDGLQSQWGPVQSLQFRTLPRDHSPSLFVGYHSNINVYSFGVESLNDEA